MCAVRLTVRGVVQGVGFRPFVHRIAGRSGVRGYVTNTPGSVVVHVEGDRASVAAFRALFRAEIPPAARVARVASRRVPPAGFDAFTIRESSRAGPALSTIPPDIALCAACRAEMSAPSDRRSGYAFINCTNCGPRFTIVRALPYDRGNTSMSVFALCPDCRREYGDPSDRRFHAEPNACPACGPRLRLAAAGGAPVPTGDPVGRVAEALRGGSVVAIRGLGGFHLAADATDDGAVGRLRERKMREEKPFAVMVRDLAAARALARLGPADEAILSSPAAPVLLVERAGGARLSPLVSPGLRHVGLFLPYTPLHRLILDRADRPLVMTSGNLTDEPIAIGNEEALERLAGIADLFLLHDREIVQRSDDSVVRRVGRTIYPIRRARGFVPAPISVKPRDVLELNAKSNLPELYIRKNVPGLNMRKDVPGVDGRSGVAGLGGEIKSTFCILKGGFAYLSQHLGDLDHPSSRDFYAGTFRFFREFLDVELAAVCRDLHPAWFTTSFAEGIPSGRIIPLQHHKAHLYALLAESGFTGRAVGVSFDGTGYGEDGAIWGGEFFSIDGMAMRRAAAFDDFPLQGGDSSVREPWKAAVGLLHETFGPTEAKAVASSLFRDVAPAAVGLVVDAISKKVNTAPTSSCGRLFDAVSAMAGVCRRASYEGQAAMRLEECIARGRGAGVYNFGIRDDGGLLRIDWKETVAGIASDVAGGLPAPIVARRFHDTVAAIVLKAADRIAGETGARHVLLSGGVFQNAYLLGTILAGLGKRGLKPLIHRQVPANDGGISLGQAYYAAHVVAGG